MATIKQGILGGFSGKVGPVVGSSWKGKAYMRARALSVHNLNTDAQKNVRAKLSLVSKFVAKVLAAVKIGFNKMAVGESEANVATRINIAEAVTGSYPLIALDWTKVKLSQGSPLPNPNEMSAAASTGHKVTISWVGNAGVTREALEGNHVMVVYNATKKTALFDDSNERGSSSTENSVEFTHSADWASDSLQVFLFTYSADGKLTSDSVRVGEVTAQ